MQLNITTDYAVRIVVYTSRVRKLVTSKELSDALAIPQSLVYKICRKLSTHGIIKSTAGVQGGFTLERDPEDITLFEVFELFEPKIKLNRCLEEDSFCNRSATHGCPIRKVYSRLQNKFEAELKSITMKDFLDQ